jgi:hypothetical protein
MFCTHIYFNGNCREAIESCELPPTEAGGFLVQ